MGNKTICYWYDCENKAKYCYIDKKSKYYFCKNCVDNVHITKSFINFHNLKIVKEKYLTML